MRRLALLVLTLTGGAHASPYGDLLLALERAQRRILIFAPSLSDVVLAEAIRRARLDPNRTVQVRVLSVPFYTYQPESVMLSLALAGVPVYEAQVPSTGGVVVVDDQGWRGDALGRRTHTPLRPMSPGEINGFLGWFRGRLSGANVLTQVEAFERLRTVTP